MEKLAKTKEMLERLTLATGVSSESALAGPLGVSTQAIYDAKKRDKVPNSWVRLVAEKYGISADWLFFCRGPMRTGETKESSPDSKVAELEARVAEQAAQNAILVEKNKLLEETLTAKVETLEAYKELLEVTRATFALYHGKKEYSAIDAPASALSAPSISLTSEE
jgi:hypothetical protein